MSDMKWIGEPLDVVGQYQKGVNLAEQGQRMQQSADMHPLKMDDAKARTNLVKQAGEYNTRTMDSRVGLSDSMARLKQTAASISENTQYAQEDIIQAKSMQDMVNAQVAEATILSKTDATRSTNLMAVQRQERDLFTDAAQKKNTLAIADINHSNAWVAQQTQDNKIRMSGIQVGAAGRVAEIEKRNLDDYNAQLPNMQIELNAISNMSYADLKDYEIPADISNAAHRLEIGRHLAQRKGTDLAADYQREINQSNNLHQQRLTRQLGVQNKLNDTTASILELKDTYGNPLFRNVDSETLTPAGVAMLGKLERSSVVYDKLNASNKAKIRNAMRRNRGMSLFPTGLGETLTGQYGAEYDTQIVLDEAGIAEANEMLVGQARAGELSQSKWAAQVLGLEPETMDAKGNITRKRSMPSREVVLDAVTKQITAITARVVSQKELEDETKLTNQDLIDIRTEAYKNVDAGLIPRGTNAADILGVGAGATYGTDGKALVRPGVGATPTTGTPGAALPTPPGGPPDTTGGHLTPDGKPRTQALGPNDPNDVMMGRSGYSTVEKMGIAANNASDQWPHRAALFNHLNRRLGSGDFLNDSDARFITKLVIEDEWKTGHGVTAAFAHVFQDDPDAGEDKVPSIMGHVRTHTNEMIREARDDLKIAVFGENWTGKDKARSITDAQIKQLTAAVKKYPNDTTKWPALSQPGYGPLGGWKGAGGDVKSDYSPSNAPAILKEAAKWRTWNAFSGRIKLYNENKK